MAVVRPAKPAPTMRMEMPVGGLGYEDVKGMVASGGVEVALRWSEVVVRSGCGEGCLEEHR